MNYIRGAVNAISAPYQYYKDLPPLNPSTLTGAIDVIVIQRPTDNGDSELVCSPFHVRFGKWQVLRPGEKKVNVSVNGHPIPFNMKIGQAGEAFFVFETDDDVPEDLITSPILQPTRPDEAKSHPDVPTDRFGAKQDPDNVDENVQMNQEDTLEEIQEPEFLDLNALPSPPVQENADSGPTPPSSSTANKKPPIPLSQPAQSLPSPPPSPPPCSSSSFAPPSSLLSRNRPEEESPKDSVDQVSQEIQEHLHVPEVQYTDDIVLDVEGYHSHGREISDRTITADDQEDTSARTSPTTNTSRSESQEYTHGLSHTQSQMSHTINDTISFPTLRATSEPPPEIDEEQQQEGRPPMTLTIAPTQEYSWEWGAFPQPSPMKTSFGKGGRIEGGLGSGKDVNGVWGGRGKSTAHGISRLAALDSDDEEDGEGSHVRSRSVPPELEGSPTLKRREISVYEDYDEPGARREEEDEKDESETQDVDDTIAGFGAGGRLTGSKSDPTRFMVAIEGRKVEFELSLVSSEEADDDEDVDELDAGKKQRGRRNRDGARGGTRVFDGRDEVEAARLFENGKIDYHRFLAEEDVVNDPRLVIRWTGGQYITWNDGSPLMQALVLWRDTSLREKASGVPSRPVSPLSDDETPFSIDERQNHNRSKSEPPEQPPLSRKPTSSSWVQWWSRSRSTKEAERPGMYGSSSEPLQTETPKQEVKPEKRLSKEIPPAESAPALPSTPVQKPVTDPRAAASSVSPSATATPVAKRKFAKTLRLTSDQLKALNLKPGANTITFSLSTSGVIACTARIFVWDSTDLVVVSDIDGTITKSDGLGHVFAMIGRDWTHLGVAKLYTDITRNGYKIMYLTSRAIGQADATRDYLKGIKQNDYQLPEGPVIMSPDRLMASLHREVIMRKPEVFKMACLRDIQRLFGEASRIPFYAGFGNRITDALSYRSVNVPKARIFTIDSSGEVKMELLEPTGHKSSYIHMTDLVDQMFPPIHQKWAPEFTDFNYWKAPVQDFPLPDFSPPSPALSARSDTSNRSTLARLRNFSLVGTRQANNVKQFTLPPPATEASASDRGRNDIRTSHLMQLSSFERLSNTLSGFAQSSSPTLNGSRRSVSPASQSSSSYTYSGSDDECDDGDLGKRRRRSRRRSMTSMPGSLDDINFGMYEGDEDEVNMEEGTYEGEEDEEEDLVEDEEEAAEEAFDEDLLAAGEMKNVPFL